MEHGFQDIVSRYLSECREVVLYDLKALLPQNRYRTILYDLMLEYPMRSAKALRPSLCIATCRALGGLLGEVTRSALALELFHNAFLVHDDIEDLSVLRRGDRTLHQKYGVPIAINVGDAMLALSLQPLLDNMQIIGLGRALKVLEVAVRMARESSEGQALELSWTQQRIIELRDADYWHLVYKKTCWYTFIAPMLIGGIIGGADEAAQRRLRRLATLLGVSFQIQDDILNLVSDEQAYGKEIDGDLWEGKRTLILIHALRSAAPAERERAYAILALERSSKTSHDVAILRDMVQRHKSVDYARAVAERTARKAAQALANEEKLFPRSIHRDFIQGLIDFVINRTR